MLPIVARRAWRPYSITASFSYAFSIVSAPELGVFYHDLLATVQPMGHLRSFPSSLYVQIIAATVDEGYFRRIVDHSEISARDVDIIHALCLGARHIVDLGCGRGGFASVCGQEGNGVTGLDNEPAAARICRGQGLPLLLGDVVALPFASASLDEVASQLRTA